MPTMTHGETSIYYEEYGTGHPVLCFAPGGMNSSIESWKNIRGYSPINELADSFRVIVFDQRNAGQSRAPIKATDGWEVFADDAARLIDHLGLESLHVMGNCIGPSFIMKLLEHLGPDAGRVKAFVSKTPIGLSPINRGLHMHMFYRWAEAIPPEVSPGLWHEAASLAAFCQNMHGGDFVFSVSRDFVRTVKTPMLVLPGSDLFHPEAVAREIVQIAPNAELFPDWRDDPEAEKRRIRAFLQQHTPS